MATIPCAQLDATQAIRVTGILTRTAPAAGQVTPQPSSAVTTVDSDQSPVSEASNIARAPTSAAELQAAQGSSPEGSALRPPGATSLSRGGKSLGSRPRPEVAAGMRSLTAAPGPCVCTARAGGWHNLPLTISRAAAGSLLGLLGPRVTAVLGREKHASHCRPVGQCGILMLKKHS